MVAALDFRYEATAAYHYLDPLSATYALRIGLYHHDAQAERAPNAKVTYSGIRPADVHVHSGREGGEVILRIKMDGGPAVRLNMTSNTMIAARTVFHGCPVSIQWLLTDMLVLLGVMP